MHLYLVQHGEAQPKDVDPDRHLTEQGAEDIRQVADCIQVLNLHLTAVWHSGKVRAQQTAEILGHAVSTKQGVLERGGLAPNDPVTDVAEAVSAEDGDLMVVGHLPFLARLAALLLTGDESQEVVGFQNGCVLCLERSEEGQWKVSWLIVPGLISS